MGGFFLNLFGIVGIIIMYRKVTNQEIISFHKQFITSYHRNNNINFYYDIVYLIIIVIYKLGLSAFPRLQNER